MSNFGLEEALGEKKIPFVRAGVGDRYVLAELDKRNWVLGGESSGHLLCLNLTTTGDGIVSALQVLAAMLESKNSLCELKAGMKKYPQSMINVVCQGKVDLGSQGGITKAVAQAEKILGGRGRVLLRSSGTEPLVRVMVEGEDAAIVASLTQDLARVVSAELG
jgi:phosphoglucosamine mutase